MAHEIENMFYVGETPWHRLGVRLEKAPTIGEALRVAGLEWSVGLRKLVLAEDTELCDSLEDCREVSSRAVVRESDGRILGVVGPDYRPLQNADAFAPFEPMLASGAATLETAGSLRGGRRVWILASLGQTAEVVPGDPVKQYVMLSNSHDGSMAVRFGFTETRIVCANTLAVAHSSGASQLIRIRHSGDPAATLQEVARIADLARRTFEATTEQYESLARKGANEADMRKYVKAIFAQAKPARVAAAAAEKASDAPRGIALDDVFPGMYTSKPTAITSADIFPDLDTSGDRVADRVMQLVDSGRGADLPGVRGTMWGAYNAVTEYLTHERGSSDDTRLDSNWFGNGAALNRKALDVAVKVANGGAL